MFLMPQVQEIRTYGRHASAQYFVGVSHNIVAPQTVIVNPLLAFVMHGSYIVSCLAVLLLLLLLLLALLRSVWACGRAVNVSECAAKPLANGMRLYIYHPANELCMSGVVVLVVEACP